MLVSGVTFTWKTRCLVDGFEGADVSDQQPWL